MNELQVFNNEMFGNVRVFKILKINNGTYALTSTINGECVVLVVNIIYCNLPCVKAISEETEDIDTHNIYINKNLPHDRMREEIKHELSHIIRDDFYVDQHVNLVERMVRMSQLEDGDLDGIDFYHHII